jgi:hypothetical protein
LLAPLDGSALLPLPDAPLPPAPLVPLDDEPPLELPLPLDAASFSVPVLPGGLPDDGDPELLPHAARIKRAISP